MAKKIKIEGAGADQIIQSDELMETHSVVQAAIMKLIWDKEITREELKESPKKVLEEKLGIRFDKNIKINLIDQSEKNSMTYVLPVEKEEIFEKDQEISDEQLETMAGGIVPIIIGVATQVLLNQTGKVVTGKLIDKAMNKEYEVSRANVGGITVVQTFKPRKEINPVRITGSLSNLL